MTQDSSYTDQQDVIISVILSTGETIQGLRCSLLRIYDVHDSNYAEAVIYCGYLNSLTQDGMIIEPTSISGFQDCDGHVWQIQTQGVHKTIPPEPPGFIFKLSASS
jgi:hypothetical protein